LDGFTVYLEMVMENWIWRARASKLFWKTRDRAHTVPVSNEKSGDVEKSGE